jgi:ComF family protein
LLSILYPSFCRFCSVFICQGKIFCESCESKIKPVTGEVFAVSAYKDPLKKLVLRKMYSDRLASIQLAQLIYERTTIKNVLFDYVVPIPLHWTRYAWRGYNQSYEMAKFLGKKLKIPVLKILRRVRRTIFQSKLSNEQRKKNVKNVFVVGNKYRDSGILKNKRILIVDDLYTTGATVENAKRPLKKEGAKFLAVAVACKVV